VIRPLPAAPLGAERPAGVQSVRSATPLALDGPRSVAEGPGVEISPQARRAQGLQRAQRELLAAFEARLPPEQLELFEQAGRTGYLSSIANPTDLSPEATAQRILGGVTGYIFGAFQRSREGELTEAELGHFAREARRGLEQGLERSRDLLEALAFLSPELESDIDALAEQVRSGLDTFIDSERTRRFG